jgi:hypothetical protein
VSEAPEPGTVGAWLAAVTPAPPPALALRLAEMLAPFADRPVGELPEACVAAGERELAALLAAGSTSRDGALDLLAVDALVTYAFEVAADDPARFEARAARAMERIGAIPDRRPG